MPYKPKVPCKHPSCPKLISDGELYCEEHKPLHYTRVGKNSAARGYGSKWRKARELYLKNHPLCVRCLEEKKYVRATIVDHIIPHKGNNKLFWDRANWQSLCERHHNTKTMTEDIYYEEEYHY